MRAIQEEVDRAREKRLLREKGMHEFIFMFERGGADHLHSDSFIQHVKQHLPSEDQDWKIALISLTLAQRHEDVRQAIQMSLNLSQCISSTYFFFFVPQSELEKKKEAKQREREAREKEARKREKAEEKEKRRREYNAQQAAVAAREQQKKKNEEKKKKNGQAAGGNKGLDDATPKGIVHDFILKHLSLKQFSVFQILTSQILALSQEIKKLWWNRHQSLDALSLASCSSSSSCCYWDWPESLQPAA